MDFFLEQKHKSINQPSYHIHMFIKAFTRKYLEVDAYVVIRNQQLLLE